MALLKEEAGYDDRYVRRVNGYVVVYCRRCFSSVVAGFDLVSSAGTHAVFERDQGSVAERIIDAAGFCYDPDEILLQP